MRRQGPLAPFFAAVLVLLGLAGCAGKEEASPTPYTVGPSTPTDDLGEQPPFELENGTTSFAHHHDYWVGRKKVPVFHGELPLETFPLDGLYGSCNAVGFVSFDFQDDEPAGGQAEVVYPGTEKMSVTLDWDVAPPDRIDQLVFRYRPANDPFWHTATSSGGEGTECGEVVPKATAFDVPVGALQFDPAHQTNLSRWDFEIWSYSAQLTVSSGTSLGMPGFGKGKVKIDMVLNRGEDTPLDPPHPDFYRQNLSRALGTTYGNASFSYVVDYADAVPEEYRVMSSPLNYSGENGRAVAAIMFPPGSIAPMGTVRLEVRACLGYEGPPNPQMTYRLAFHGADGKDWNLIEPAGADSDCDKYVILDPNEVMVDSPYESTSQWEFRIVPITSGKPWSGYFQGSFALTFNAYRTIDAPS